MKFTWVRITGWYSKNSNTQTHEVAQLKPNELGFYDMSGNLWDGLLQ